MKIEINDVALILKEVFENDSLIIESTTKAADIEEWDSLNHIYLIVEIEKKYKIKFTTNQIQGWQSVGDIVKDLNEVI
jgi:acyl carrier protein